MIHGLLNVNKPAGRTSRQIVDWVRRISGMRKAGHAGTLDPDATGVLLVCLGDATKLFNALQVDDKEYVGTIVLGMETDTQDASGTAIAVGNAHTVTQEALERVCPQFVGKIEQIPPMFSAVKHRGKRLYRLARKGVEVVRDPRQVTIHELEILWIRLPQIRFRAVCSKGTYVRTLAADIGTALGCGAYLRDLVRTRSGVFHLDNAVSLDSLERKELVASVHTIEEVCRLLSE